MKKSKPKHLVRRRKAEEKVFFKYINEWSSQGIIHVGANEGQERYFYHSCNRKVLWFEPSPETFKRLEQNIKEFKNQQAIQALIFDSSEEIEFNILGARSSIYKPIPWSIDYSKTMKSQRLDEFDLKGYDCLVVDTQGADLNVLKSLGDKIAQFNLIKVEVIKKGARLYKDIPQPSDFNEYMATRNFKCIKSVYKRGNFNEDVYIPI
tara:strand:- start:399 stop:1019 length:621 start_codon:yes stop_codon:yes gene_type:complete